MKKTRSCGSSSRVFQATRLVIIDRIPTVENLAQTAFNILKAAYRDRYGTGLHLHKLVLHETPNCWAEVTDPA